MPKREKTFKIALYLSILSLLALSLPACKKKSKGGTSLLQFCPQRQTRDVAVIPSISKAVGELNSLLKTYPGPNQMFVKYVKTSRDIIGVDLTDLKSLEESGIDKKGGAAICRIKFSPFHSGIALTVQISDQKKFSNYLDKLLKKYYPTIKKVSKGGKTTYVLNHPKGGKIVLFTVAFKGKFAVLFKAIEKDSYKFFDKVLSTPEKKSLSKDKKLLAALSKNKDKFLAWYYQLPPVQKEAAKARPTDEKLPKGWRPMKRDGMPLRIPADLPPNIAQNPVARQVATQLNTLSKSSSSIVGISWNSRGVQLLSDVTLPPEFFKQDEIKVLMLKQKGPSELMNSLHKRAILGLKIAINPEYILEIVKKRGEKLEDTDKNVKETLGLSIKELIQAFTGSAYLALYHIHSQIMRRFNPQNPFSLAKNLEVAAVLELKKPQIIEKAIKNLAEFSQKTPVPLKESKDKEIGAWYWFALPNGATVHLKVYEKFLVISTTSRPLKLTLEALKNKNARLYSSQLPFEFATPSAWALFLNTPRILEAANHLEIGQMKMFVIMLSSYLDQLGVLSAYFDLAENTGLSAGLKIRVIPKKK